MCNLVFLKSGGKSQPERSYKKGPYKIKRVYFGREKGNNTKPEEYITSQKHHRPTEL